MNAKELQKVKELYISNGTRASKQKAWSKLWSTTDDGVLMNVAKIGSEIYSFDIKHHYSYQSHQKVSDLPEFWNRPTLLKATETFLEGYVKPLIDGNIREIELKTLQYLINKYN